MGDYLLRFLIGGLAVSLFAVAGDIVRPKSFAGLFGAAPSIAFCTLALALAGQGMGYTAADDGRGYRALFLQHLGLSVAAMFSRTRRAGRYARLGSVGGAGRGRPIFPPGLNHADPGPLLRSQGNQVP
jgi:hypothetical protein